MKAELLTASRMNTFLACPRKHYYSHELGLRRAEPSGALHFGSAMHAALEARANGATVNEAYDAALKTGSEFAEVDAATLYGLIGGYFRHYEGAADVVQRMDAEIEFKMRIDGSRAFMAAGKIDGLGVLKDGRMALIEHKTCSEDISAGAPYWERLRFNIQLGQYVEAARAHGWNVECVIYDVIRKPSIRMRQNETPEEFGQRLLNDCAERPVFYFARCEVPIIEEHIQEFKIQREVICQNLLHCKRMARKAARPEFAWVRNCNGITCRTCEYSTICLQNIRVDSDHVPTGFIIAPPNPELDNGGAGAISAG